MGCTVNKPIIVTAAKGERNLYRELRLNATKSLSNPSLVSITSDEGLVRYEESPSALFNTEDKLEIFSKFARDNNISEGTVNTGVIRAVANLNEVLAMDEHILFVATKFWHLFRKYNPNYVSRFEEALIANPDPIYAFSEYDIETKLIIHIMYVMRFEKVLISAYEDSKDEKLTEIYQLLALSHLLMGLDKYHFEMWSIQKIKFFIHIYALTEENRAPYIYFIELICRNVCDGIDYHKNKIKYIRSTNAESSDIICRENYRLMKKWNNLVHNLTRGLNKPIEAILKQMEESKNLYYNDVPYQPDDNWKIIKILMKGYRFKHIMNPLECFQEQSNEKVKKKSLYKLQRL